MKTMRGVSWSIVLALMAAAPVAAQQGHQHGSQDGQEQGHAMTTEGTCPMAMMPMDATAAIPGHADGQEGPMAMDCACPMMPERGMMAPQVANPATEGPDARRHRARRATGPSRIPGR